MAEEIDMSADDFLKGAKNPIPEGNDDGKDKKPVDEGNPNPNPDNDDKSPDINKGGEVDEKTIKEFSDTLRKTFDTFNSDTISDEDKALKEDILKEFKATKFNANGDVLDAEGKIIKTFNEIVKHIASQEEALFDDKGNQIDKEGKIVATKEQLDSATSEVNQIAKELGYEFVDANDVPKVYPKGKEGLKLLAEDIATYKNQEFQENFLGSNPVLREVAKHLLAGNDLDTFDKPFDYSGIEIKGLTKEQKVSYVKKSLEAEGMNPERASKIAGMYSEKELDAQTQEALDVLQNKEADKEKERSLALQRQEQEQEQQNIAYWNNINAIVSKGDLEGFNIPENERKAFFNYLAVPVKDGMSQDQIDRQSSSAGKVLKEAFYRYKKYDVTDIVKETVSSNALNNLRNKIKQREELNSASKSSSKDSREVDVSIGAIR